jgi:diguanylate cyclase (GGDEF)-like protein
MNSEDRKGDGAGADGDRAIAVPQTRADPRIVPADQALSDEDQSAADTDQTLADADQSAAADDQSSADGDQRASDQDQATSDRDHASHAGLSAADESAYDTSRNEREIESSKRLGNRRRRANTGQGRDTTAATRDRTANARDEVDRSRHAGATTASADVPDPNEAALLRQLEDLAAQAAADRARAAIDRARAAVDRANAARERARLEAELRQAHLDELTGAYRRDLGRLELSHEIDRARRADGRFVVAFVDVDRLKEVNDHDGHAAGDHVLQTVVREIRARLRSFDPIIRYGGDEFVCGLSGTDLAEAKRRFDSIGSAIEADAHVGISVGFAALTSGDTADALTERADVAMLETKAIHHARA